MSNGGDATMHASVSARVALALGGLLASAIALATAPILMPGDYSWVANTTSESAAQGVSGAWLARLGLLLFGLAALLVVTLRARAWPAAAVWLHSLFGALLVASAAFSTRPWRSGATFDHTEDALHSVAATGLGFAFALGVVAMLVRAPRAETPGRRTLAIAAVVASTVLPAAMGVWPDAQGVLQRSMFVVAYAWFVTEAALAHPNLVARRGRSTASA